MAEIKNVDKMFSALTDIEAEEINGGTRPIDMGEDFRRAYEDFIRGWNRYKG
jgi:hypothetical protein